MSSLRRLFKIYTFCRCTPQVYTFLKKWSLFLIIYYFVNYKLCTRCLIWNFLFDTLYGIYKNFSTIISIKFVNEYLIFQDMILRFYHVIYFKVCKKFFLAQYQCSVCDFHVESKCCYAIFSSMNILFNSITSKISPAHFQIFIISFFFVPFNFSIIFTILEFYEKSIYIGCVIEYILIALISKLLKSVIKH